MQGEEQFILRTMSRSHANMHLKSAPQKLNFLANGKSNIKKLHARLQL